MQIAHIILAHKNPGQLEFLIKTMSHQGGDFYIHIDKKVGTEPFEYLEQIEQVYLVKNNVVCNWGGYSIVESIIHSIEQVKQSGIKYDFVNILSGQCFPIKPISQIHNFLENNKGSSFIEFDEFNDTQWWRETQDRYKKFHLTDMKFKGKYILQAILNTIMPKRTYLEKIFKLYGGNKSTWCIITYDCAEYFITYLKKNPKLVKYMKFTWGSDEFIVPTVLMNSPLKDTIINKSYRYIDWSDGGVSPKLLTINDYNKIINSDGMFARKFDMDIDAEILHKLHKHVCTD